MEKRKYKGKPDAEVSVTQEEDQKEEKQEMCGKKRPGRAAHVT